MNSPFLRVKILFSHQFLSLFTAKIQLYTAQPIPQQQGKSIRSQDKEKNDNSQGLPPEIFDKLLSTIKEQQVTIKEQAEEIGILKHTIVQLRQESAGRVSGAESSTLAGVG